jgi:hypothetical protein
MIVQTVYAQLHTVVAPHLGAVRHERLVPDARRKVQVVLVPGAPQHGAGIGGPWDLPGIHIVRCIEIQDY